MALQIDIGSFFRAKEEIEVFPGVYIKSGEPSGLQNAAGNEIIPSKQFLLALSRLELVKNLLITDTSVVLKVQSSTSKKVYTLVAEVDDSNKEIKIAHKCKSVVNNPPLPCWHIALLLTIADITVIKGKARQKLREDWSKEDIILFLEEVYQDIKKMRITVDLLEPKATGVPSITINLRTINQLLMVKAKGNTSKLSKLGNFIDPLGGVIIKEAMYYAKNSIPFILIGDAGSGKTLLIKEVAKKLGRELFSMVVTSTMMADDIIGMWKPNEDRKLKWEPGILPIAMVRGGILYLDELPKGRGALLAKIYSVIDTRRELYTGFTIKRGDRSVPAVIKAKPGFVVVASGNPGYKYGNINDDKALFDRFVPIKVPYLPPDLELLLMKQKGFPEDVAKKAVSLANRIRKLEEAPVFSTRLVEKICRETIIVGDFASAVDRMVSNLLPEDAEVIRKTALAI